MSYLYTRDIILVIAITKCQRAKILPIRARCSVCLEMASISRMRTAISRGEWQPWTAVSPLLHARRPRGCQSGREKRQDESYGQKSPWVTTLSELFSKIQANAGSWLGTKNSLYHCAQSANSFSWVLFGSSYTTAIVSITTCLDQQEGILYAHASIRSVEVPERNFLWIFYGHRQHLQAVFWSWMTYIGCTLNKRVL